MRALYYEAFERNVRTGMTEFSVNPENSAQYRRYYINHVLVCRGKIGVYEKNTPLIMDGKIDKDGKFHVSRCEIAADDEDATRSLLKLISPDLSETMMNVAVKAMGGDAFGFAAKKDAEPHLSVALKSFKNGIEVSRDIIARLRSMARQELMTKTLMKYGIGIDSIESALEGGTTIKDIEKNPYLSLEKYGIDIKTLDEYAAKELNISPYHPMRLMAYLHATLKRGMKRGDSCMRLEYLVSMANRLLSMDEERHAEIDMSVAIYLIDASQGLMEIHEISGDVFVYLSRAFREESEIISNILRLERSADDFANSFSIEDIESQLHIRYNRGQRKAFSLLKTGGVKILTGPPGSGKTAVIKGLLKAFGDSDGFILGATTGMAAKVMSEATGQPATTVHIMLDAVPSEDGLIGRDLSEPIDRRLIIIDECSMMGIQLFSALLRAVRSGSLLILVGDEDQLLSVDYGNVLHDLIDSGTVETCRLNEIMRQGGSIRDNAIAMNHHHIGGVVLDDTFDVIDCQTNGQAMEELKKRYKDDERSQILCPIKKGELSAEAINMEFRDMNQPVLFRYGSYEFRLGQKVVLTRNNYEDGYINGDVGYLVDFDKKNDIATVWIDDDRSVFIERKNLKDIQGATCITIHKSQGSEYENVHIVLPDGARVMETTRLIYTAVTRGKRHVTIYNVGKSLQRSVLDMASRDRLTLLDARLNGGALSGC